MVPATPPRALTVHGNAGPCHGTCQKTGAAGATSRAAPEGSRQPGKGWMVPRNAGSHPPSLVSHKVGQPRLQPVPRNAGSQTARHGWRWPRRAASRIPKAGINGKERDMRKQSQAKPSQEPSKPRRAASQKPKTTRTKPRDDLVGITSCWGPCLSESSCSKKTQGNEKTPESWNLQILDACVSLQLHTLEPMDCMYVNLNLCSRPPLSQVCAPHKFLIHFAILPTSATGCRGGCRAVPEGRGGGSS